MISEVKIDSRPKISTLGIRIQVPMKIMSARIDPLVAELSQWAQRNRVNPAGPPYLRYYVIDMDADMDIEFGYPVSTIPDLPEEGRITAGILPAGRYASLTYTGSGFKGNKALIEWARDNHIEWDRWDDPKGDAFRCRYESYLTDPKVEPRKEKWLIEVAIKLREDYR